MANREHLKILKQGADAWNQLRMTHKDIRPDLNAADLSFSNLRHVDLDDAALSGANLTGADFTGADFQVHIRQCGGCAKRFRDAGHLEPDLSDYCFSHFLKSGSTRSFIAGWSTFSRVTSVTPVSIRLSTVSP